MLNNGTHRAGKKSGAYQGLGDGVNGEMLFERYTFPVISYADLMYSVVNIVNSVLYT